MSFLDQIKAGKKLKKAAPPPEPTPAAEEPADGGGGGDLSETSAAPSPKKGKLPAGLGSCATNPYVSGMYGPKADALHRFRLN